MIFEIKEDETTLHEVELNTPTFEQMLHALSLIKEAANHEYILAGKQIYDFCKVKNYPLIEKNNSLFASLCIELAHQLVVPQLFEVKKK